MSKAPLRDKLLLAISEVHSGNGAEGERIVDAVLSVLSAAPSPGGDEVERVARAINPRAWEVMDHGLRKTQEKYAGQRVSWPVSQFQHKESMDQARAAIAAMRPTNQEPTP